MPAGLNELLAYGMYRKDPDVHGVHFVNLPKGSVILSTNEKAISISPTAPGRQCSSARRMKGP